MNEEERNSLQEIITQALEQIKANQGKDFNPGKVNLVAWTAQMSSSFMPCRLARSGRKKTPARIHLRL